MKKRISSAEHYFLMREANENNPAKVYGCSLWDMPDGHCLRREMERKTLLQSPAEVRRWGRKWADISEKDIEQAVNHLLLRAPDYLSAQTAADNEDAANIFQ